MFHVHRAFPEVTSHAWRISFEVVPAKTCDCVTSCRPCAPNEPLVTRPPTSQVPTTLASCTFETVIEVRPNPESAERATATRFPSALTMIPSASSVPGIAVPIPKATFQRVADLGVSAVAVEQHVIRVLLVGPNASVPGSPSAMKLGTSRSVSQRTTVPWSSAVAIVAPCASIASPGASVPTLHFVRSPRVATSNSATSPRTSPEMIESPDG